MSAHDIIVTLTFIPEIFCAICFLPIKKLASAREWWFRLIEDSDGDPHHNDGLFLVVMYASLWCFHIAFIAGIEQIFYAKDLGQVYISFCSTGCLLLGVRVAMKNQFNNKPEPK